MRQRRETYNCPKSTWATFLKSNLSSNERGVAAADCGVERGADHADLQLCGRAVDHRAQTRTTAACRAAFEAYLMRESTEKALDRIPATQGVKLPLQGVGVNLYEFGPAGSPDPSPYDNRHRTYRIHA